MIQRALDAEDERVLRKIPMMGSTLRSVKLASPIVGSISEVWCEMGKIDGGSGDSAWMKTSLDPDQVRARLETMDWKPLKGSRSVYVQPFDPVKDAWIFERIEERKDQPGFDPDEWLKDMATGKWHVQVGDEGWIHVAPRARVSRSAQWIYPLSLENYGPEELGFPFLDLVSGDSGALCLMAMDVPGNEEKEEVTPSEALDAEIRILEAQLRDLEDADEMVILAETGDILLTATETDGGIAFDLEAAMPTGEAGELSVQVLEAGLVFLRLVVFWVGPELSRDLESTVFRDTGESIVASAVVSRASLYEAIDRLVEHGVQVREMKARLRMLRELQASTAVADEDP